MPFIQHSALTGAELHEPKGAAAAAVDKVYVSDGAGSGAWKTAYTMGWENFDDVGTTGTPIPLTLANTQYVLTNDAAGPVTNSTYRLPGNTSLWNAGTSRFDFTSLDVGDVIEMRVDITPTTSGANHTLDLEMNFSIGGTTPFTLTFDRGTVKTASTGRIVRYISFFIGSADIRDNPCSITLKSDSTGDSVVVEGWFATTSPVLPMYI